MPIRSNRPDVEAIVNRHIRENPIMPIRSNRNDVIADKPRFSVHKTGPALLPDDAQLTVAVIIAAHRAERWILECLESVRAQRLPSGVHMDIRVGVDGCHATAAVLEAHGERCWWSAENVGPYVIRNSLIGTARADAYAIFDADDMMRSRYLSALLRAAGTRAIAGAARFTVDSKGRALNAGRTAPYQHGVCVIPYGVWERLGGYQPWRMAADTELTFRARHHGVDVVKVAAGLYDRRKHGASLTQHPATKMGSPARRKLANDGQIAVLEGSPMYVDPVTTPLVLLDRGETGRNHPAIEIPQPVVEA